MQDQPAEREVDGDADRDGHDDWVDLPKPPPKPSPRFDHLPPVEACHKYCDVFSDCDEIGKACGEPGRKDMRARCHTMCETNARGRDHLLTIGPSGCASAATLQVYVGMSIECVCGGQYCPMVMKNCSEDDPIFKSDQECYDTCNAYPQLGSGGSKTGNNVRCRIYHAYNNDNPGACENASPSGGTACVQ